jgi:poly-gamma-glutamate capsule biosynthesis protein CapA/YwtB (metallophosphatase superfamily)
MNFRIASVLLLLGLAHSTANAREIPISLVAVGDVNLNRTRVDVRPDGMYLWGKVVPFDKPLKKIKKFINGDVNFCNLETTVMDRNDVKVSDKAYNFKCHPNAVRQLQKIGFNLFSIANNHVKDYGKQGYVETRKWLDKLGKEKPLHYAGAGQNIAEASQPAIFKVQGVKVAFGAVSISTRAKKNRAGVASVYTPEPALKALREAKADIRILSMHAGKEKDSKPVGQQLHVARLAIAKYDVDIVIGHHAHVVQGIERYKDGLIMYGLGNFSMRGARNMGSVKEFRNERDFGLLARIKLIWNTRKKKLKFHKMTVLPVYDMHSGVHPFAKAAQAKRRVESVNKFSGKKYLGRKSNGLHFEFKDGVGVHRFGKTSAPDEGKGKGEGKGEGKGKGKGKGEGKGKGKGKGEGKGEEARKYPELPL